MEDFFTSRANEFFGGEGLIFTKFFRGTTYILQGYTHILWNFSAIYINLYNL